MTNVTRRTLASLAMLLVAAVALAGCCAEAMVTVRTGTEVVCLYGHKVSSDVKSIEVPASESIDYKVVNKTIVCAKHRSLEILYDAAQKALAVGDTTAAKASLAQVVKVDPKFRKAAEQIRQIDAGQKPAPDTDPTPDGQTPPVPETPAASLTQWAPDKIAGYTARPVNADSSAITREYLPSSAGPVSVLVVVVEQYPTAALAKKGAVGTIDQSYNANRSTFSVEGRTLEFGMNANNFAAVGWSEGSIGIVAEARSAGGPASASLRDVAAAIIP
jgi:hypothetical protein